MTIARAAPQANRIRSGCRRETGFTYFALIVLVMVMGMALAASGEVWHTAQKRENERELLFVGNQYRQALTQYYLHSPGKATRHPTSLDDLLLDPRYPDPRRYLRKLYPDPITRSPNWGLVTGPQGEIVGVHSLSDDEPVKQSGFKPADKGFEGKTKYSEWLFMESAK